MSTEVAQAIVGFVLSTPTCRSRSSSDGISISETLRATNNRPRGKSINGNCKPEWPLLRHHDANMQLLELFLGDGRRTLSHEVLTFLGLRKCDDIADAGRTAQQCDHAIQAERNSSMRRSTISECLQHIPEAAL